jgi:hypothetical protein
MKSPKKKAKKVKSYAVISCETGNVIKVLPVQRGWAKTLKAVMQQEWHCDDVIPCTITLND